MAKEFVNAAEVSKITGIAYSTVLKHIESGLLPASRRGDESRYCISIDDMELYAYNAFDRGCTMYNPHTMLIDRMKIYGVL